MKKIFTITLFLLILANIKIFANSTSINQFIDSLNPKQNALNVPKSTNIIVYFSQDMNSSSLNNNNIKVYGMQTGYNACQINYNTSTKSVTINPNNDFKPGEVILVSLASNIQTSTENFITPFVFTITTTVNAGPATFYQYSSVMAGTAPETVAPGDINGNGSIDFVVPNLNSSDMSILVNNGSGNFTNSQTLTTGNSPRLAVLGDFDLDGDLDIAEINNSSSTLIIYSNNGSGSFSNINSISLSRGPFSIATIDIDGDGDLDLAAACYSSSSVLVLKNNGNGGFSYPDSYVTENGPVCVKFGDIDNDGDMDIVCANWNANSITVFKNNGNGIFGLTSSLNVSVHPHSIALADIDHDGYLDFIEVNSNSNNLIVFKNNGSGSFSNYSNISCGNFPVDVVTGDIDGDGNLDIAVSNNQYGVTFFTNDGNGNFNFLSSTGITIGPRRIALVDLDGDRDLDLAVPNTDLNNVLIFKNGPTVPSAPLLVYPANNATGLDLTFTFIWYAINNVSDYKIQISTQSNFSSITDSVVVTTNQYSIPSGKLNNSTTYYWRVYATNENGPGPWSSVWNFTTIIIPPPPPAPVLISPADNTIGVSLTPTLYWEPLSGISNYKVQVSLSSSFTTLIDSAITSNNSYVIPYGKLFNSNKYYWRVNATNNNGTSQWSTIWSFITLVDGIFSINSEIPKDFMLYNNYPNPFNPVTKIKFDLPEYSFVTIYIYDILGRIIESFVNSKLMPGSYEIIWNGKNLSSGVYYYKLVTEKHTFTKRMILLK
jgi:hypothetical protein